jgi:hypothetical protein
MKIKNYSDNYFSPMNAEGLEELVLFPDGGIRGKNIPNSSVWVFDSNNHKYRKDILANDVGCGMAAFMINAVDYKRASDKIADYLGGKNILGRGNHFVDICSKFASLDSKFPNHNVLVIHSDGKSFDNSVPECIEEAKSKVRNAQDFRKKLGYDISKLIGSKCELIGDWPHNSVEIQDGKVIYRTGVIKVCPEKVHIMPAHIGSTILFYTVDKDKLPPYSSMPHATGRCGPRGDFKVDVEKVKDLRDLVYIPETISDSSLRSEHPSCYNNIDKISEKLVGYLLPLGEVRILSYIGKV